MGIDVAPYTATDLLSSLGTIVSSEPMSLEAFTRFCEKFPDLIAERETSGKVVVMSPVKSGSGENESYLNGYVFAWNLANGKPGKVYSPSTGFLLEGEEVRCGDAVWISNERLAPFLADPDHKNKWVAAVPEFVIELRSGSDRVSKLKQKMEETWLANGVLLAWLVDPMEEVVYIYRAGQESPEEVRNFDTSILSGEEVLPGFEFPLAELNL
ncbi:MAG: Uma2 family endonuclease [Bacteroidota bacterium]